MFLAQQAGQLKQLATRIAGLEGTAHDSVARVSEALAAYHTQLSLCCEEAAQLQVDVFADGTVNIDALRASLLALSVPVPGVVVDACVPGPTTVASGEDPRPRHVDRLARTRGSKLAAETPPALRATVMRVVPLNVAELACERVVAAGCVPPPSMRRHRRLPRWCLPTVRAGVAAV